MNYPCLENYIILSRGCNPTNVLPASGLYVDILEGVSVENLAMVTPEKLLSANEFVAEKLQFAGLIVENLLKAMLAARGIELVKIGTIQKACNVTNTYSPAIGTTKGIKISKKWLGSDMARIFVQTLNFKTQNSGSVTITIADILGNVLWTWTGNSIAGSEMTVAVNEYFDEDIILIRATDDLLLAEYQCDKSTNCRPCGIKKYLLNVEGLIGSGFSSVGFLGACIRLDCTDKGILCKFLDRLGLALLYQLGSNLAEEWNSPNNRLNIIKTHGAEWAATKAKDWRLESEQYLANELSVIMERIEQDKYCHNCKGLIVTFPMIP